MRANGLKDRYPVKSRDSSSDPPPNPAVIKMGIDIPDGFFCFPNDSPTRSPKLGNSLA